MPDLSKNPTERDALAEAIIGRYPSFDPLSANGIADAVLAAGFHRTPTPPTEGASVVTTVEELGGLPSDVAVRTRCGDVYRPARLLIDLRRGISNEYEAFPATVLTPAPKPDTCEHCRHRAHGAVCFNMASDNDCECSTPEPSADDGYVSRNVYDYDEPEPPADVREALATLVQEQFPAAGGGYSVVWEDLFPVADAILAALPALGYVRIDPTDGALVEKVARVWLDACGIDPDFEGDDTGETLWQMRAHAASAVLDAIEGVSRG